MFLNFSLLSRFFSLFLFFSFTSFVQAKIPLSAYGAIPDTSLMVLSPSGNNIGFRKKTAEQDLYVVFSLLENKVIASIEVGESKPLKAHFVTEDEIILIVSKYQQTGGTYGTSPQNTSFALSFNIRTNKAHRLLTAGERTYDNQWELSDIAGISSDGQFVYMPAYVGGFALQEWDGLHYNLLQTRLGSKRKPTSFSRGETDTRNFFMDDQDNILARTRFDIYDNEDNLITREKNRFENKIGLYRIQKPVGNKWVDIYQEERSLPLDIKGISLDKKSLIISKYQGHGNQRKPIYFSLSLATGEISPNELYVRENEYVESVLTNINKTVYGIKYSGILPKYEFFDEKINARIEKISNSFANTSVNVIDWSDDWKKILVFIEGQESSGEYLLVDENNQTSTVGLARPNISYEAVHPISQLSAIDDEMISPALITVPNSWDKKSKLPVILLPHGATETYNRIEFNWIAQYFAEQGYVVVQPEFSRAEAVGSDFDFVNNREWRIKMQKNLSNALTMSIDKGIADPERICVIGASYGGYTALSAAVSKPDLFKCIVSINGISDVTALSKLQTSVNTTSEYTPSNDILVQTKLYRALSPVDQARKINAPVLLIHAKQDKVVSFKQSSKMYKALQKNNKESTLVNLDNDGHYLSYEKTRLQALTEMDKFVKKHI